MSNYVHKLQKMITNFLFSEYLFIGSKAPELLELHVL